MIGSLIIDLEPEREENNLATLSSKLELYQGIDDNEYSINVKTSLDEDLLSILKSKNYTSQMLEEYKYIFDDTEISDYVSRKMARNELLEDIEEVVIFGTAGNIKEYLERNPLLKSKRICIGTPVSLKRSNLTKLKTIFGENANIMVKIEGNTKGITLDVYEKTIKAIEEIVNKIKSYNYSPYEALIHTYDLVRDKFYNMEDETESYAISRDLSHALLGDKIVCLGFSNIFNAVLKGLNINSIVFSLSLPNDEPGHARVLSYVNDEKYNIEGLYFFDPTFDCKKNDSNDFLLSYRFFGKTKEEMDLLSGYDFIYETYSLFGFDEVGDLEDDLENEILSFEDLIRKVKVSRVNRMLRLLGKETLEIGENQYTRDEIMEILCEISDFANRPIDAEVFLQALYRVRRNEYYENPTKYAFDMKALIDILVNSKIASNQIVGEKNLLAALFGIKRPVSRQEATSTVNEYLSNNGLDIDIERIKLARTLKNICEQKREEKKLIK